MVGSPEQKGVRRAIGYEEPLNVSRPNRAVGKTSDHYLGRRTGPSRLGIRLAAQTAYQVHHRQNERNPQDSKHHERFGILEVVSPVREEMVIGDKEVQTGTEE
jgi:hypothetical protein